MQEDSQQRTGRPRAACFLQHPDGLRRGGGSLITFLLVGVAASDGDDEREVEVSDIRPEASAARRRGRHLLAARQMHVMHTACACITALCAARSALETRSLFRLGMPPACGSWCARRSSHSAASIGRVAGCSHGPHGSAISNTSREL